MSDTQDATQKELERLRARVEALETRERLMDLLHDAVYIVDMQGRIIYWNRGAVDLYGWTEAEALGQHLYELVHPDPLRPDAAYRDALLQTGAWEGVLTQVSKAGRRMTVALRAALDQKGCGQPHQVLITGLDITAQAAAEEKLIRSEANLAAAQRVARTGSWELDLASLEDVNANPLYWSDEIFRIFGHEPGAIEVSNENFFAHVHPDDRAAIAAAVQASLQTGEPYDIEHRIIRPDGSVRFVHEHSVVERDPATGKPAKMTGTCQDVTERRQAEEAAREVAQARELDRLKSAFVSAVSHELRTPLTSIRGYVEFLEEGLGGELPEQAALFVRQLGVGAARLELLVNDLLDFATIEAGTFRLQPADVDLAERVRDATQILRPQLEEAGLELALDLPDEPATLRADGQRLTQVLLNLMGNAIKFTPRGGTIHVALRSEDDGLRCEVRDTGEGIPPEAIPKLFQRFSQLEGGRGKARSTGLGLSISKALVEAHGGEIGVSSEPARGATFWFKLPA